MEQKGLTAMGYKKMLETATILTSRTKVAVGESSTYKLIVTKNGKLAELDQIRESDGRNSWTKRIITYLTPSEAMEEFPDITEEQIAKAPEKIRDALLAEINKEVGDL